MAHPVRWPRGAPGNRKTAFVGTYRAFGTAGYATRYLGSALVLRKTIAIVAVEECPAERPLRHAMIGKDRPVADTCLQEPAGLNRSYVVTGWSDASMKPAVAQINWRWVDPTPT